MAPEPLLVLRAGPWRGAALLTGPSWRLLYGAPLVFGLREDPYAVGLAPDVPVTLIDGVDALDAALSEAATAGPASADAVGPNEAGSADPVRPARAASADEDGPNEAGSADPVRPARAASADEDVTAQDVDRPADLSAGPDRTGAVVVVDSGHLAELTAYLDRLEGVGVVHGEPALTGLGLLDVVAVMDRLRSPGGCPWDAEQTHASLRPYLLEEAHEAAEAIDSGDRAHLAEELGDVLLQVVFHARLGQEDSAEPFDIDDVAAGLVAKLVRRHPHVFGDVVAHTPEQVAANWERIKAAEKAT